MPAPPPLLQALVRPLARAVTYTRWLHLLIGAIVPLAGGLIYPGLSDPGAVDWLIAAALPVPLVAAAALLPSARRAEGLQARLMLLPGKHARVRGATEGGTGTGISATPSASWTDRGRTALWLVFRMEAGLAAWLLTIWLLQVALVLSGVSVEEPVMGSATPRAAAPALAPFPVLALLAAVVAGGGLDTRVARRLLGPSVRERMAALEDRTERLLERNRIARELHDSLGHALTLAVVQAGAARAAGDPDFTDRALATIEETGRAALEDLERVLLLLRETGHRPAGAGPGLDEAARLLDSARSSGAVVEAEITGPVEELPGPVSREAYRMLQEALTNALRHAGPVPVAVRVAADPSRLTLLVTNPLPDGRPPAVPGSGSGLRGIRERAALLGGEAKAGVTKAGEAKTDGTNAGGTNAGGTNAEWRVTVTLPLR